MDYLIRAYSKTGVITEENLIYLDSFVDDGNPYDEDETPNAYNRHRGAQAILFEAMRLSQPARQALMANPAFAESTYLIPIYMAMMAGASASGFAWSAGSWVAGEVFLPEGSEWALGIIDVMNAGRGINAAVNAFIDMII